MEMTHLPNLYILPPLHSTQLGFTALVYASQNGHVDVVQMLLWHCADANICTLVCRLYVLCTCIFGDEY